MRLDDAHLAELLRALPPPPEHLVAIARELPAFLPPPLDEEPDVTSPDDPLDDPASLDDPFVEDPGSLGGPEPWEPDDPGWT